VLTVSTCTVSAVLACACVDECQEYLLVAQPLCSKAVFLFKCLADLQACRLGKRLPYSYAAPGTEHAEGMMSLPDSYFSGGAYAANIAVSSLKQPFYARLQHDVHSLQTS